MTTIVTIIAILALLFCLLKAANSVKYQKCLIAVWLIAVFLFGVFFNDVTDMFAMTSPVAQFILAAAVMGAAVFFIRRLAKNL